MVANESCRFYLKRERTNKRVVYPKNYILSNVLQFKSKNMVFSSIFVKSMGILKYMASQMVRTICPFRRNIIESN